MVRKVLERSDVIPLLGELFRERGFAGASLSEITKRTGLGKGSLYHHFPDGKEGMAKAVLDDVAAWFETEVFAPLREVDPPDEAVARMFEAVDRFFHSGRRVCLVGIFALDDTRDHYAEEVRSYFAAWTRALASTLERSGVDTGRAHDRAEDIVAGIQGALVLARSQDDPEVFMRALRRLRARASGVEPPA
ncbi:MAG: TetR/AcrR family transcriptional regulator [Betaproteobacteria bacterium]|nr:TetR/AcrR family transcriptional regulator [Betaproteobacteria bacterium]